MILGVTDSSLLDWCPELIVSKAIATALFLESEATGIVASYEKRLKVYNTI